MTAEQTWAREWLERTAYSTKIKQQAMDAYLIQQDRANRVTARYGERGGSGGAETSTARQQDAWIEQGEKESVMLKLAIDCAREQEQTDMRLAALPNSQHKAALIARYSAHKSINVCAKEFFVSPSQFRRNLKDAYQVFYDNNSAVIDEWIASQQPID